MYLLGRFGLDPNHILYHMHRILPLVVGRSGACVYIGGDDLD